MKSSMIKSRRFLECDCYSPDHLLCIDVLEEDEQPDNTSKIWLAEFAFLSNYNVPRYNRFWQAIKFVLFKKSYHVSDSICISEKNIDQLQELVDIFKKQMKNFNNKEIHYEINDKFN
jgi:hypothetical protein